MAKKSKPEDPAVEPSVRVFTRWSPALVFNAEVQADSGNLTQAAKICSWLLADDRIRGCLSARIQGLLGLVPGFEKSGDRRRSGRAIKALEADEDFWASYPEDELWLMLAWGLLLGAAPMRHNPQYVDGHDGRLLPCPEFWHPAAGALRWDFQTQEWKTRVASIGNEYGVEVTLTPGDGTWILHTPFGKHRPWELGLWKPLAWWKLLKDYGRGDWARHMEKGSLLVLTQSAAIQNAPAQNTDTRVQRDDSAQTLYQRGKDAVAALPVGKDLKLVEAKGEAYKLYSEAANQANEAFAVCIRGGNLTTSVEGGSKAAAEVQERTGDFVNLRFDAETTSNTLHKQSLPYWAEWNFGDRALAPWPDYPVAPQRNLKHFAETLTAFNKSVSDLESNGFDVDRMSMIEEFELTDLLKPGERPKPAAPVETKPGKADAPADDEPAGEPATPEQ